MCGMQVSKKINLQQLQTALNQTLWQQGRKNKTKDWELLALTQTSCMGVASCVPIGPLRLLDWLIQTTIYKPGWLETATYPSPYHAPLTVNSV